MILAALGLPIAAAPSVSLSVSTHFTLESAGAALRLSSTTSVEETLLNEAATRERIVDLYEPPHGTLVDLRADAQGKVLGIGCFTSFDASPRDAFIGPGRIHRITWPADLRPNDTVGYSYRETYEEPVLLPLLCIPSLDRVRRFEITVDHPAGFHVDFELFEPHGDLHSTIDRSSPTRTSISFQDLAPAPEVPCDPFPSALGYILTQVSPKGSGPSVTAHRPEDFTRWYLDWIEPSTGITPEMRSLLAEELSKAPTPREKARLLFDYVKSRVRNMADEGGGHDFVPHPAGEVLDKKWGDCKDKARLLATLGKLHSLPIHMVLISTKPAPEFSSVNVELFNHAICALDDGGEILFMDPTSSHSELGDPPISDQGTKALILDPVHPRYLEVKVPRTGPDLEVRVAGSPADPKGARATLVLRHALRASAGYYHQETGEQEFLGFLARKLGQWLPRIRMEQFRIVGEDRDSLELEAKADLSGFLVVTEGGVFAPRTAFRAFNPAILERTKDSHAVDAGGPIASRLEVDLSGTARAPKAEHLALGGGEGPRCQASLSGKPDALKLVYEFDQPFRLVPAPARAEFFKFCEEYLRANRSLFCLERSLP